MSFSFDDMDDIIKEFLEESAESLEKLDQRFIELEKNPEDTGLLNDIFRSIHTIKGAAGFLGFEQMVELTHLTENILDKLRKGEMEINPFIMDAILESVDMIKVLLNNIKLKKDKKEDLGSIVTLLTNILEGRTGDGGPADDKVEKKDNENVGAKKNTKEKSKAKRAEESPPAKKETVSAPGKKAHPKTESKQQGEDASNKEKEHSIRVDIDRLDSVMNLVGELVLSRNRLVRLGSKMSENDDDGELVFNMEEALGQLDLVTTDLQLAVMKMRMQPIAKVFNKFPRMVRDLARQSKKEIELVIEGEETELDKTVIEEISDPLVHLIRNSVDHGLESPEERERSGKPKAGTITLSAYQEGRNIVVSVADDGKGINPKTIKETAIKKRIITEEEAEKLSDREAMQLIFVPGFSTARKVSNISGRGVGMDVVKTNITRINGTISVESDMGKGTRMIFKLPLTLAIIPALTVESNGEVYGIPLSMVIENIRVMGTEVKMIDNREAIQIRDSVFPVIRLSTLTGTHSSTSSEWLYIVIIGIGEKRLGLLVDKLHGQEEIVMKSMGKYLEGTDGIAGACITGDGNVILVLDVAGLVEASEKALCAN